MELRFPHLILEDYEDMLSSISGFLVAHHPQQMHMRFTRRCVMNSVTNQQTFFSYWMMVQDQYWFCLHIHVFSRHDLQTESDQLLIKTYISLTHCMSISHLKEQKYVCY